MIFLNGGTPEEKMWAPVAGFFMGLVFAGCLSIVPLIYSIIQINKTDNKSMKLKTIIAISTIWITSICLMYIF